MNEIVNKYLWVWDKIIPEMHLKQLGFTYRACRLKTYLSNWTRQYLLSTWDCLGRF